jgi:DnaJ-class molecular chaperone
MLICTKGNAAGSVAAALLEKMVAGQHVDCDACSGRGWTGYSEYSGESCDVCDGSGTLPLDESLFPKLAAQTKSTHGDFGRVVFDALTKAEEQLP